MADKSLNLTLKMNGVEVENTLKAVKKKLYALRGSVNKLEEGTKEWIDANKRLGAVEKEYGRMIATQRKMRGAIDKTKKSVLSQIGSFAGMATGFTAIFSLVQTGIKKFAEFTSGAIDLAREAKGVQYAFEAIGESAQIAFQQVKDATRGTLSDLDIKKAIVEFDTFNISQEHTADLFEFLTVRATQTGKSVEYLQQSLVEGLSKESKLRIDNLGISASELNEQLEKTPNFVEAVAAIAKKEVAAAGAILDEAANSNNKWNAQLANTQLQLGNLIENSGAGSFFKGIATSMLAAVTPAGDLSEAFEEQASKVIQLKKNLPPLIDEYEALKSKTVLSKNEQDRLKDVIDQIADAVPSAITAFDEYGNALDISADSARNFIQAQQARLAVKNQEAIEQQTGALKDYTKEVDRLTEAINNRNKKGQIVKDVSVGDKFGRTKVQQELSDEEIAILQAKLNKAKQMELGTKQYLDELSGDYLEKIVKREEQLTARTLEEAQKRADALGLPYGPEATAAEIEAMIKKWEALEGEREKLGEAARKKADEARKKYASEELNIDKFLAKAREDRAIEQQKGLEKELAQIDAKYAQELEKYAEHADRLKEIEVARDLEKADAKARIEAEYLERIKTLQDEDRILKAEEELEREIEAAETAEEKEELRLEFARQTALDELEELKRNELLKVEAVENAEALKAAIIKNYKTQADKINRVFDSKEKEAAKDKVKWTEMTEDQKLSFITNALGSAAEAFNKGSAAWKAIKIAETSIATFQGAVLANTGMIEAIPGPVGIALGAVAAGLTIATGLAQVNKIANTKIEKVPKPTRGFVRGGYTDDYGTGQIDETGHEVAGTVHVREYVVPEFVRKDPEVPQILDYLETKRKKKLGLYADGGDTMEAGAFPINSTSGRAADAYLISAIDRLTAKLDEPIYAETLYGVEAEVKRQEVQKKLDKIKNDSKIKKL